MKFYIIMSMIATAKNKKLYWNSRALSYPRPFEPSIIRKTRAKIKYLRECGIDFNGKDLLDIGCGSGIYALALARRCKSVTGIDSSKAMLANYISEAKDKNITNASCLEEEWGKVPEEKIIKKFDIVLASMTAAVQNYDEVMKMEKAAREWCVYIGWAGERHNALLEKIYNHHGVKYLPPPGCENIIAALEKAGHLYHAEYMYEAWIKAKSIDETLADLEVNMTVNAEKLDKEWTLNLLKKKAKNGIVRQKTKVRKAIIIWQPQ